ncbi:MAG TPA: ATP-binding protein, partial [Euzebya sp.]|nr:ATP-binding protein [Euzebya sp.]
PGLSRSDVDVFEVQGLVRRTGLTPPAPWRVGRRRRWQRLLDLLGVHDRPDPTDLAQAISLATAARAVHQATDPLTGGLTWPLLVQAQQRLEQVTGEWMEATARDERRLNRSVRASRAALATALRAGRATRRGLLGELGSDVLRALPVWVGTLGDIDDLLPMNPGIFDLVVLDEASSIDQPRAAPALLRGKRAVVVGDPHQLRHVSFVADRAIGETLHRHMPGAPAALTTRLDVRQNSLFDVAAGCAPVRHLDEHFRSAPHLFDFVGRRLYDDTVRIATLTPANDASDLISVTRLDAQRNAAKVVTEEVTWVLQRLDQLREDGVTSVGVVSPFRAQADALEQAVLRGLDVEDIEALGLRVGTVHAFQGMERDVVLVSLGVGLTDSAGTWRFAADRNLFAVMATRARQAMEWVVSAIPPEGSLIAAYLDQVDRRPSPQRGVQATDAWTREVAGHLEGLDIAAPYVAGRHQVDLCLADGRRHLAVETTLHREGTHAHIRRHVELARNGWPMISAFPALWTGRAAELGLRLRQVLAEQPDPASSPPTG